MALSGTINGTVTNLSNHFSFYATWTATQDVSQNCSFVTVSTYWETDNTSYTFDTVGTRNASITINGTQTSITKRMNCAPWPSGGKYLIQTVTSQRVDHNTDGTKSITISAKANGYASSYGPSSTDASSGDCTASATVTLDAIPRYATVTQSIVRKTETSITMSWASDATIDYVWYSTNGGSNWTAVGTVNATAGNYTISSLSANTAYNIKTRVRRKDSQLNTDSTQTAITTYNWPYATTMPNITIGDTLTVGLYNPLGRSVAVYFVAVNDSLYTGGYTTGTSISGWDSSSFVTWAYQTISNQTYAHYSIRVTYDTHTTTIQGGTYQINKWASLPSVALLTYQDTNSTTTTVTGDNQKIVRNKSTVRFTAEGVIAQNSASVSSVVLTVNGNSYNLSRGSLSTTYTGVNATINAGSNVTATVTVTDSRGLTDTKKVTVNMLQYTDPTAIITLQRQNNYYSDTTIKCDAQYSYLNGGNTITITYACTKAGDGSPSITGTLSDNVAVTKTLDNNYRWTVVFTLTDRLNTQTVITRTLQRGQPIIFFDKKRNGVGLGAFPSADNTVEVASDWTLKTQGHIDTASAKYYRSGEYAMDLKDSDIIGANAIYFNDLANARDEGLGFPRSTANMWDTFYLEDGEAYIRRNHGIDTFVYGTRLLTVDDLYYKNADTLTLNYAILAGHITSAYKAIRLGLTVPKLLTNITSVTVNTMTGTMRGNKGYLDSASTDRNWLNYGTASVTIVGPNMIRLDLNTTDAISNVDINTPIEFYSASSGLAFTFNG